MRPHSTPDVPFGFCHCGCGRKTNLANATVPELGYVRGQPMRYLLGHSARKSPHPGTLYEVRDAGYETPCWFWLLQTDKDGYGTVERCGVKMRAHRYFFELHVGDIPPGLVLDHLCRNTSCVNPDHLEPVTDTENILRGDGWGAKNARKTHCDYGHPLSGDNLYIYEGRRKCRSCNARRQQEYRERRKRTA